MGDYVYEEEYYELTDEDRKGITNYFNDGNLKELIEFCEAIGMVGSFFGWKKAEEYLKLVGEERFFRTCSNCGKKYSCNSGIALNVCGTTNKEWIPEDE